MTRSTVDPNEPKTFYGIELPSEYWDIPQRTLDSIELYMRGGVKPGSFTLSLLENKSFTEVVMHADPDNCAAARSLMLFVYNRIPTMVWGSSEKVAAFLSGDTRFAEFDHRRV